MPEEKNNVVVIDGKPTTENPITNIVESDNIILLAEQAEKKVAALQKIMTACLSMTTPHDWVLIGGKPYLQESGCTKVANLIGISFEIAPNFPVVTVDSEGYKTFTYRVRAFGKNTYVEGEGQRSMRDDFFSKTKDGKKPPELINERDVRIAALTNAKANAIKSIIPGLKNIEVATLTNAGIDTTKISGYTFKTGKESGKTGNETEFKCEGCGKSVTGKVASFSQAHYSGHIYCVDCQNKASKTKEKMTGVREDVYEEEE